MTKRERDLRRLAKARGWRLERTNGSGHWRLRHPAAGIVIAAASPRVAGNVRVVAASLRRAERQAGAK